MALVSALNGLLSVNDSDVTAGNSTSGQVDEKVNKMATMIAGGVVMSLLVLGMIVVKCVQREKTVVKRKTSGSKYAADYEGAPLAKELQEAATTKEADGDDRRGGGGGQGGVKHQYREDDYS